MQLQIDAMEALRKAKLDSINGLLEMDKEGRDSSEVEQETEKLFISNPLPIKPAKDSKNTNDTSSAALLNEEKKHHKAKKAVN
jgi:hypothetical protein